MACYFERKNAIRKDPMAVISGTLAFGVEIAFVLTLGFFIMSASPKPDASYDHAAQAVQKVLNTADEGLKDG